MEEFIKPWMKLCNPDLIIRFWRHKGSPGQATVIIHGVRITFLDTPFGNF